MGGDLQSILLPGPHPHVSYEAKCYFPSYMCIDSYTVESHQIHTYLKHYTPHLQILSEI